MLLLKALRCVLVGVALFGAARFHPAHARTATDAGAERDRRLKWFREARFGLFVHWGLYAVPAGEWKGKLVPGIGEWIMNRARLPVAEYEQLAGRFNPVEFDADAFVRLARGAGMKYLVITAKHHDGFAMYHSKASRYNITDATSFKRDPLRELADACRKYGVRLGFYYSQTQDWHERDAVGRWLKANSESVYGTRPSPFPYEQPWGIITTKPGRVYLHVFEWPKGELLLYGLRSKVRRAYLLSNRTALRLTQRSDASPGHDALTLKLPPAAPDAYDSVVALEVAGEAQVDTMLTQQPDGTITLPAHLSEVHRTEAGEGLRFDTRGVAERWTNRDEWLGWDFRAVRPGEYEVLVVTSEQKYGRDWEGGHELLVEAAGQSVRGRVERDGKEVDAANPYWPYVISKLGRLRVGRAGKYNLTLKPQTLRSDKKLGLTLVSVRLVPAGS